MTRGRQTSVRTYSRVYPLFARLSLSLPLSLSLSRTDTHSHATCTIYSHHWSWKAKLLFSTVFLDFVVILKVFLTTTYFDHCRVLRERGSDTSQTREWRILYLSPFSFHCPGSNCKWAIEQQLWEQVDVLLQSIIPCLMSVHVIFAIVSRAQIWAVQRVRSVSDNMNVYSGPHITFNTNNQKGICKFVNRAYRTDN